MIDKKSIFNGLQDIAAATDTDIASRVDALFAPDAKWRVAHPINEMVGAQTALEKVYLPLIRAFPDVERRDLMFVGGSYEGRHYVGAMGHYCGTFEQDWLGIPASGEPAYLRYGEVYQVEDGRVVQANLLWDILDLVYALGYKPLPDSRGVERMWAGPFTNQGLQLGTNDAAQSNASLEQTLAMHQTLVAADQLVSTRESLLAMDQRLHWHPKMMWFGPAGIGTTRGLAGFVDHHQLPFRQAFQRPQGTPEEIKALRDAHNANHYVRIGDGAYSLTGGWPAFPCVHHGDGFLGQKATHKLITMRVMDFYHHHEGLIRENWVPIDMLDVLMQLDIDLLSNLEPEFMKRRAGAVS